MKARKVLTLGRMEVAVHPALLLYAAYAVWSGHGAFMAASMLSILLHECAHGLAAALLGQVPASMELTPLGAVLRLEDESRMPPLRRALMLLAGPGMTLALCSASILLSKKGLLPVEAGRMLLLSNASILLVNLLPALPLDGGRLLTLLLENFLPPMKAHRVMQCLGTALGAALIGLNVLLSWRQGGWNLSLAFAGCCLLYAASAACVTHAMAEYRCFLERKIRLERKTCCPVRTLAVFAHMPLHQALRRLPRNRYAAFLCLEAGSMRHVGLLTESQAIQQYLGAPQSTLAEALAACAVCHDRTHSGTI